MKLSRVVIVVTFALFVLPRGEAWGDSSSHDEEKDAGLHDILRSHFRPPLAEYGEPWGLGRYGQMPSQAVQTVKLRGSFRPPLCEYCDEDEDDFDARRRLSWRLRWVKGKKKGRGIRLPRRLHRASQDEDEDDFEARRRLVRFRPFRRRPIIPRRRPIPRRLGWKKWIKLQKGPALLRQRKEVLRQSKACL